MAAPDPPARGGGAKIKPGLAIGVLAVAAVGGYLWLRHRKGGTGAAGGAGYTAGTVTSTTTYGLGPEWFATWVRQHHGPPKHRPRGWTDWQGHR